MHLKGIISYGLLLAAIFFCAVEASAQTAPNSQSPGTGPSTATSVRKPVKHKKKFFSPRLLGADLITRKSNVKHTARYEYYDRIEKAAKEKKKMLKELAKAQYSDPRYFGHKKLPKKRPFYRMRYCDECGIRH